MNSSFRIDYVEAALLGLLLDNLGTAYGSAVEVASLRDEDFDEEGQIVMQPPAVRVRYLETAFNPLRDNQRLTYQAPHQFEVLCYAEDLRGPSNQRKATLVLLASVLDQLAGARLNLADGSQTMPISLSRARIVPVLKGPIDTVFSVSIEVEGIAQFSGANANPGGG